MSKRVLAPLVLLIAAACSLAAVFVVHRIEAAGGPLSEPYATQYFSPGLDGATGTATVRFTTRAAERISITIHGCDGGPRVHTLVRGARVDGSGAFRWDGRGASGTVVPDGCYRFVIRRAGDDRRYQPAKPTWLDTRAPIAAVDRSAIADGYWRGLIFTEPGVRLDYATPDGEPLDGDEIEATIFRARIGHSSGEPKFIAWPKGAIAYRFSVRVDEHPRLRMTAVDLAGNETPLPADLIDRAEVVR